MFNSLIVLSDTHFYNMNKGGNMGTDTTTRGTDDESDDTELDFSTALNESTPPHPEQEQIETAVEAKLSELAVTIEPNWLRIFTEDWKFIFPPEGFRASPLILHGPLYGETDISDRAEAFLGPELWSKWVEVFCHTICTFGTDLLNPRHQIQIIEGRTQFKLRDPRPFSIAERGRRYSHLETQAHVFLDAVWDRPYSAVTVDIDRGHDWIDLLVIDKHDVPTGDIVQAHVNYLRPLFDIMMRGGRCEPVRLPCRIDVVWGVRYRKDTIDIKAVRASGALAEIDAVAESERHRYRQLSEQMLQARHSR